MTDSSAIERGATEDMLPWKHKSSFRQTDALHIFYYPRQYAVWADMWLGPDYEQGKEPPSRAMEWSHFLTITAPPLRQRNVV